MGNEISKFSSVSGSQASSRGGKREYRTPTPPITTGETERAKEQEIRIVPSQYRTGKVLGSGTYAIVKEAIHIKTGQYYACKVINKKLMEGREYMVRNEISVLKRIYRGHPNIITLHDYFETTQNLYLCFDLCTGGELFDRICAKGNYYEADAASLVRTIFKAVRYIHDAGIVHGDLTSENLLFRSPAEDADIMIAGFSLSRVVDADKPTVLTEICGTPHYMAPEIFKKTGHGKPVDVWAMGVNTYFLLAGYTPFDRDTQQQEMEAIIAGDYNFEPEEYWSNVSETAKSFVRECLTIDPVSRPTAAQCLQHKWLASETPHFEGTDEPADLLPHVKKPFNAKRLWRKAGFAIRALNRMSAMAHGAFGSDAAMLSKNLAQFKAESEKEIMETMLKHSPNPQDRANFISAFRQFTLNFSGSTADRYYAARKWADLAYPDLAPYHAIFALIPRLLWFGKATHERYGDLKGLESILSEAVSAACSAGKRDLALEWLEQGRTFIWGQILLLPSPVDDLRAAYPEIAQELSSIAHALDTTSMDHTKLDKASTTPKDESQTDVHPADRWVALITQIRGLPNFSDFLRSKSASALKSGVYDGPIVLVNVSARRSDAIILQPKLSSVETIQLSGLSLDKLKVAKDQLTILLNGPGSQPSETQKSPTTEPVMSSALIDVLEMLWKDAIKPIFGALGCGPEYPYANQLVHVTWSVTREMAWLPLYAAGIYQGPDEQEKILNYAVSSYTPSLTDLFESLVRSPSPHPNFLAIAQHPTSTQPSNLRTDLTSDGRTEKLMHFTDLVDILLARYRLCNNVDGSTTIIAEQQQTFGSMFATHSDKLLKLNCLKGRLQFIGDSEHLNGIIANQRILSTLNNLAKDFHKRGFVDKAIRLYTQILHVRMQKLGKLHLDTLESVENLVSAYFDHKRADQAAELHMVVLEARKEQLGISHPDTLRSMTNIADICCLQTRLDEAANRYLQVLKLQKGQKVADISRTTSSLSNLAESLHKQARFNEAVNLYRHVIEARKEQLGEEHADVLAAMNNLAEIYCDQKLLDKAADLHLQVLESQKHTGVDPAKTLSAVTLLAQTYQHQGLLNEAARLHSEVMEVRKEHLGTDHIDTLSSITCLANIYHNQGRLLDSVSLHSQVLECFRKRFGDDDLNTLAAMRNLAVSYRSQGKLSDAAELYSHVVECQQNQLGIKHADSLDSMMQLAEIYHEQGLLTQAVALNSQVLDIRKELLGDADPKTLAAMNSLAKNYRSQGLFEQATKLFLKVLKRCPNTENIEIVDSLNNLALTYECQGNLKEAAIYYAKVVEMQKEWLGNDHADTSASKNNLSLTCEDLGWSKGVEELPSQLIERRKIGSGELIPDIMGCIDDWGPILRAQGDVTNLKDSDDPELNNTLQREPDQTDYRYWLLVAVIIIATMPWLKIQK